MFLPLFIAILLGLATPTNTNHASNNNTTVTVNGTNSGDPNDPGTDPGDPDPGTDTGGEGSHVPPKNP